MLERLGREDPSFKQEPAKLFYTIVLGRQAMPNAIRAAYSVSTCSQPMVSRYEHLESTTRHRVLHKAVRKHEREPRIVLGRTLSKDTSLIRAPENRQRLTTINRASLSYWSPLQRQHPAFTETRGICSRIVSESQVALHICSV